MEPPEEVILTSEMFELISKTEITDTKQTVEIVDQLTILITSKMNGKIIKYKKHPK